MIEVDTREIPSGILDLFDGMGVKYVTKTLLVGDYIVTGMHGAVVVERKTSSDYIGSLVSGHLATQLESMSRNYEHSILLVEGSISSALFGGGVSRKSVFSSLVGSILRRSQEGEMGSISILMVESIWDIALVIERILYKLNTVEGLVRVAPTMAPQIAGANPQVRALCAIDGIGEVSARALLRKFKTLWTIARASTSEIEEVKGIGSTLANNVHKFMRTIYTEDDSSWGGN